MTTHDADRDRSRRELARWLAGELDAPAEARLRRRLDEEPGLARAAAALRRTWEALDEPAGTGEGVPPGFRGRVMARVREEAAGPRLAWSAVPAWGRAAALVAGLALGAGLGNVAIPAPTAEAPPAAAATPEVGLATVYDDLYDDGTTSDAATLAEGYAAALSAAFGGEEGT